MNYRNARRLANGWIDCEIEHPVYGWIPFTCDPEDTGAYFDVVSLHRVMDADPSTASYVAPTEVEIIAAATAEARILRANLLATYVDAFVMNPLRWADLSVDQQSQIVAYRKSLLDITDQPGFPFSIMWPEIPSFAL